MWRKTQLTWAQPPQDFKNSPTLFGEALTADLAAFPGETLNCTLLQYVDDLLPASPTRGLQERHQGPVGSTPPQGTGCHGKRLRSADRRSGTWGLSSQKGIRHSDMRGSKPSVQYLSLAPGKKSVSSLGLPDSARSRYWASLKLPGLCLKPQQGLVRSPWSGGLNRKRPSRR